MGSGCSCCSSKPVYQYGKPMVSGGEVIPNFEDGKLFRIVKSDKWYYYNDTQEYYMHVQVSFGAGSDVEALGKAVKTESRPDGACTVKLDVLPLETQEFVKVNKINGFDSKFSASPFTAAERSNKRAEAISKVNAEIEGLQKYRDKVKNSKELLQKARSKSKPFVDLFFPPLPNSIYRPGVDEPNVSRPEECFWQRPQDFLPKEWHSKIALYEGGVKPGDIDQGGLGDCYFLCSVAAVAGYSDIIKAMFRNDTCCIYKRSEEKRGGYQITFNINGWWRTIVIDSYVPTRTLLPCFARNRRHPNELWPCFVEKAYAKAYGSYAAIVAGFAWQALEDLTGFPCYDFYDEWKAAVGDSSKADALFKKLDQWSADDYLLSVSTPVNVNEAKFAQLGLGSGHAYTVLEVHHFPVHRLCLLKIRNPWGDDVEWTGDWSDESPKWKEYPMIKGLCRPEKKKDGTYWMEWRDVVKYFDTGCVCYLKRGTINAWQDYRVLGQFDGLIPNLAIEIVVKSGSFKAFCSLRQRDRRGMPANDPERKYAAIMLSLAAGDMDGSRQEVILCSTTNPLEPTEKYSFNITRSVSLHYKFEKGKKYYLIPRRMDSSSASSEPIKKYVIAIAANKKLGTGDIAVNFVRIPSDSPVFRNVPKFDLPAPDAVETVFQKKQALSLQKTYKGTSIKSGKSVDNLDYDEVI